MHQWPLHRRESKQPYADDCTTVCGFWKKIMFTTFIAKLIRQRRHSRSILRDVPLSAMKYISPSRSIIRVSWLNLRRLSGAAEKKQIEIHARRAAATGELPQIPRGYDHSDRVE
jgi:hypothetical protein